MKEYARKPYMSDNYDRLIERIPQKAIFDVLQEYNRFEKQSMYKKPYLARSYEEMEQFHTDPIPYNPDPYDDGNFPPIDAILVDQPEDTWDEFEDATAPEIQYGWVARFDNTFWEPITYVWGNAGSWDAANKKWLTVNLAGSGRYGLGLTPINGWEKNFKPLKIRVTFETTTSDNVHCGSADTDPGGFTYPPEIMFHDEDPYYSTQIVDMDFAGRGDIYILGTERLAVNDQHVTNIEFYEEIT